MQVCVDNHYYSQESLVFPPSVTVLRLYIYLVFCRQAVYNTKPIAVIHMKVLVTSLVFRIQWICTFLMAPGKLGGKKKKRLKFFLELISNTHTKISTLMCSVFIILWVMRYYILQPSSVFSCRAPSPSRHLVTSFTIVTAPHLSLFANI